MKPTHIRSLLALSLCSLLIAACQKSPPSAQLGPIKDLPITIEIDESASFVTDIIPAVFLVCQTQERKLIDPASRTHDAQISPRIHTTHGPSQIQLAISLDQTYTATTPEPRKSNDIQNCRAYARFYLNYQGASDSKSRIPNTPNLLADSWFTTDFGEVHTQKPNTDLTSDFTTALQGTYRIHCVPDGTTAGKPAHTLVLQQQTPDGRDSPSKLITHLNRPCTTN